jgi:hypothetical protein
MGSQQSSLGSSSPRAMKSSSDSLGNEQRQIVVAHGKVGTGQPVVCGYGSALRRWESPASSGSFSVHSITRSRVLFQCDPVSGTNRALGRHDAGRWTPSDPFRPDKFGNCIAIFIGHLCSPLRCQ